MDSNGGCCLVIDADGLYFFATAPITKYQFSVMAASSESHQGENHHEQLVDLVLCHLCG